MISDLAVRLVKGFASIIKIVVELIILIQLK